MEELYILRCTRCQSLHKDLPITHIDTDGSLYCKRCAAYMKKVGGYDLMPFDVYQFIEKLEKK
jgi:late competence protein required for DNA uptake (superfamily II DNA/RNA helicase)